MKLRTDKVLFVRVAMVACASFGFSFTSYILHNVNVCWSLWQGHHRDHAWCRLGAAQLHSSHPISGDLVPSLVISEIARIGQSACGVQLPVVTSGICYWVSNLFPAALKWTADRRVVITTPSASYGTEK